MGIRGLLSSYAVTKDFVPHSATAVYAITGRIDVVTFLRSEVCREPAENGRPIRLRLMRHKYLDNTTISETVAKGTVVGCVAQ